MGSFDVMIDRRAGPVLRLIVSPPGDVANGPPAEATHALLDTGSEWTIIDRSLLDRLGLKPRGTMAVANPLGTGTSELPIFDVDLCVCDPLAPVEPRGALLRSVPVLGATTNASARAPSVLGRDVIDKLVIVYDGPRKRLIVSF